MPRLKRKLHLSSISFVFLWMVATAAFLLPDQANGRKTGLSCAIPVFKSATVANVNNDGSLRLASGETVRMIGILPVRLIENASSPTARKLNALARQTLRLLRNKLKGKRVELRQSARARARDRYDRLLAHVYSHNGQWLQGMLLQKGLARSQSFADNHNCMNEMLRLENKARNDRLGLWRFRIFSPQQASSTRQLLRKHYRFTLVEGRIAKVAHVKKWTFLNFGDNWRDDFTIAVKRKYKRKIERSGLDLLELEGKRVRVRGWIERWNGPLIKVTHKQQIEVLEGE